VDRPEWTEEDFARARPFRMGRPPAENPKVHISFRLASDLVDAIRKSGRGYNARVERVLRAALERGELGEAIAAGR
jgi:hypothetical protein